MSSNSASLRPGEALSSFYAGNLDSPDPWQANNYFSARSQLRRFKVVTDTIGLRTWDSVADVGCGTAEYSSWLYEHGYDVHYEGFEYLPEMVDRAKLRHPGVEVTQLDAFRQPIPPADYAVAIGLIGVVPGDYAERVHQFIQLVENLHQSARKGWAMTILTDRPGPKADTTGLCWYMDVHDAVDLVAKATDYAPSQLRMDYHPFDALIVVRKGGY